MKLSRSYLNRKLQKRDTLKMTRRMLISQQTGSWTECLWTSWLVLALLLSALDSVDALVNDCGGYFQLDTQGQQFYSPDYPNSYPEGSYCVWIIMSPRNYRVKITFSFQGDMYNGVCSDLVEVRDGGPASTILGTFCGTHTNQEITSSNIWLYIKLKSDQIGPSTSPVVLSVLATAEQNDTAVATITNQVPDCRSYEFECPNRVCISMSYRCDAYNDCGCLQGCDEDGCGSLSISISSQVAISICVGFVMFVIICIIAFLFEGKNVWIGNKTEAILEKEMQKQVVRRRASRMYSKFIGPSVKSNSMIFDRSANKHPLSSEPSPRFDSALKITDC